MFKCPHCDRETSFTDRPCVHCGHAFPAPRPEHRSFRLTSSRVGTWLAVGFLIVIVVGLCLPSTTGHPEPSPRGQCKLNFRTIGIACRLYADDNDGRFPDTLGQLDVEYLKLLKADVKSFICPNASDRKAASYALVPSLRGDMPGDFILAYDSSLANHGSDGRNVLFLDSGIEWWRADREVEFQKRLAEQAEKARSWKPGSQPSGKE